MTNSSYEMVIGVEVHAQIISNAKLFSGSPTRFGASPNSQVSFIDAAFPGMLPVLNGFCVAQAVKTGLALNAEIHPESVFDRKNYFYPDLPSGYQISQFTRPIVGKGWIDIDLPDGSVKRIGITRLHLEQDAGKSLHDQHPTQSYIDLNRAGVGLMEIVSEPDMRSAEEVAAYVKKLRSILQYLGTCDGNMEQGNLRCDVNLSLRRPGQPFGTRCELKNLNSVRFIVQAIAVEAGRQQEILDSGGQDVQETRLFDPVRGETRSLRSKEDAMDYRYFPDPDLLPLRLEEGLVERMRAALPELPDAKKARLVSDYGLSPYDAGLLVVDAVTAGFFETLAAGRDAKLAANWMLHELFALLNKQGREIGDSPISAEQLGELVDLIQNNTISGKIAKDVLVQMAETGKSAGTLVAEGGLQQVTDTDAIAKIVAQVLADNPGQLADYRAGKDKLFGFFVGQVMKLSQGKANPDLVNSLLRQQLG
ncbi:MAG: Asp-tRNA(Asn)/Glu-tRNA(Gln) amidotransferase subunit GatB [Alphaproteobacteria bacterium]|nr:Asp-tRNA(Asn)/Glu-tRNA(Gln) amidotransferase subunit GatB [Alphaproteobacteria bacterium]